MTENELDLAIERYRRLVAVRAWPEWDRAQAKLRELECSDDQIARVRLGVLEVAAFGGMETRDGDVAWHIAEALSVLLRQGYEFWTPYGQPGNAPDVFRSPDGVWTVGVQAIK